MDFQSSVQSIYYLTTKKTKSLDRWTVLKLIFFADRYHLRKYGRTVTKDNYFAMENGPVATTVYDIIKGVMDKDQKKYVKKYIEYKNNGKNITFKRNGLNIDNLSETDKEALEFSLKTFGKYSPKELVIIAHKYPEWKKFENVFKFNKYARLDMNIKDFFDNPTIDDLKENIPLPEDPYNCIPDELVELTKEAYLGLI